jgi:CDP-paratose synthetase
MKTILITGINGYLGSHLAKFLSVNYNIIGLEYSLKNLFRIKDNGFKVYSVENGIPDKLFAEQTIDAVIHTATFYGRQDESVQTIANANLFIPFDLLDRAIENNCNLFINTDTVLDRFVSTYALTKHQFQEWLYIRRNEIKVINMQLEHFYGPDASTTNFITFMIDQLKNNVTQIDLTFGEQQRNFVYIDDVCSAYQTVVQKTTEITKSYTEFQVATNQLMRIKEVILYLKEITNSTSNLNFGAIPYRENELMKSETDNSALLNLGWEPENSLKKGLKKCLTS